MCLMNIHVVYLLYIIYILIISLIFILIESILICSNCYFWISVEAILLYLLIMTSKYKVSFNFNPETSEEISVKAGDIVIPTSAPSDGWYVILIF